jgi:nitrogen fixation/metabolism regulation signal transduction histidine kinase
MRWLLLVLACLGAISLFLLATASANTELFAKSIDTLLVINGVLGALLMAVVGAQLWQLWRKRRSGVFGSRLAVRLVLVFALVAVLPGALVYAASVLFIGRSIESWFDVRVDRALEGGLNLGRNALDYLKQETVNKASQIALTLAEGSTASITSRLNRAAEQAGVYEAALFSSTGGVLAVAGVGGSTAPPEPPPAAALRRARLQQTTATPEQTAEGVFVKLRVVVPVNTDDQLEPLKVLQVMEPVPKALAQDFETVRSGRLPEDLPLARVWRLYARADLDAAPSR